MLRRLFRRAAVTLDDRALAQAGRIVPEVMDRMAQAFWAENPGGGYSVLNVGNYRSLFGRPVENLSRDRLDWLQAIHPEDRPRVEAALPRQLTGDFDETFRAVHPDGTVKWLRHRAFLIPAPSGEGVLRAGFAEDVTAETTLRERLRQDQEMKAIGAIAGGVSHDFNNILAIIQGNLELARLDPAAPQAAERIDTALAAARRGAALTHRLLAYARRQPLAPTAVDPARLLAGLDGMLRSALGHAVTVEIDAPEGLWPCRADPHQLETVLLNLAINARDAMPEGGRLRIEVANVPPDAGDPAFADGLPPGAWLRFTVSDDGAGMTPETLARVFEPFFTTKEEGGSGLGLPMAQGFAAQSGGRIAIDSAPGRGATVTLHLPRAEWEEEAGRVGASPERGDLAGLRVLLVEDEGDLRATVAAHLERLGCVPTAVAQGADALVLCRLLQADFDLLLTDLMLPGRMSGRDLATLVRSCIPGIAVAFMTGFDEEAGETGPPDAPLLRKPFGEDELAEALRRAAARRGDQPGASSR